MPEASDILGILHQNLLDAGCSQALLESCMAFAKESQWEKLLPLLAKQKTNLLRGVHNRQKQIDCLDYLIYSLKNKGRKQL